ncbi:MAG: YqeG family HAD IIIA-type phosphatase [Fimbriimonas ginsengisoli]|uniref:YqeG family HAD IIIA-type phosphatase n=1 Tax=Fimbriimonas ginsengisoli TaxID=1005039 RepID=A0A931PW10_FIMGI|nr:YqeG family HAD IIIA-type phosphatase [Fimbriimonas ginsengisoli]
MPEIRLETLWAEGKRLILLDVDNTLVEWRGEDFTQEVLGWLEEAKQLGFGLCILSNTRNPARLARIADRLGIRAIQDRFKPSRRMYMLALKEFSVEPEQAVMVGDQILTDVLGANRSKIEAIWVHRISRREFVGTRLNRIVERGVLTLLYRALPVMAGLPDPAAPEEEQTIWTQLSRFAVVGVSSFAIDFGIFMALFKYAPWHGALLSQEFGAWLKHGFPVLFAYQSDAQKACIPVFKTFSASIAILNSFYWNRRWTFGIKSSEERGRQFRRFVLLSVTGLGWNVLFTTIFASIIPGHPNRSAAFASVVATVLVAFWNFGGQRLWAFRKS